MRPPQLHFHRIHIRLGTTIRRHPLRVDLRGHLQVCTVAIGYVFQIHRPKPFKLDPVPRILMWRQCDEDIFRCHDSDGSTIFDGYVGDGICDHIVVRRASHDLPRSVQPTKDRAASDLLLEQTRVSILSWNPGPRRGTPGASQHHIAGRWYIIALQESIQYLQHDYATWQFHVTHFNGCAVLFTNTPSSLTLRSKQLHSNR